MEVVDQIRMQALAVRPHAVSPMTNGVLGQPQDPAGGPDRVAFCQGLEHLDHPLLRVMQVKKRSVAGLSKASPAGSASEHLLLAVGIGGGDIHVAMAFDTVIWTRLSRTKLVVNVLLSPEVSLLGFHTKKIT